MISKFCIVLVGLFNPYVAATGASTVRGLQSTATEETVNALNNHTYPYSDHYYGHNLPDTADFCFNMTIWSDVNNIAGNARMNAVGQTIWFTTYSDINLTDPIGQYNVQAVSLPAPIGIDGVYTGVYTFNEIPEENFPRSSLVLTGALPPARRPGIAIVGGTGRYKCASGTWFGTPDLQVNNSAPAILTWCLEPACLAFFGDE